MTNMAEAHEHVARKERTYGGKVLTMKGFAILLAASLPPKLADQVVDELEDAAMEFEMEGMDRIANNIGDIAENLENFLAKA